MLSLEEAQARITGAISPVEPIRIDLTEAAGGIVREAVSAPLNLPRFDNSAMDGYAVRSADLKAACGDNPVSLEVVGETAAGQASTGPLGEGQCARVFTGSPIPEGADAVVMQEDVVVASQDESSRSRILVSEPVAAWEFVRLVGEDVKAGDLLVTSGKRLSPGRMGLLSAMGIEKVSVARPVKVGLVATGSELREPGEPLQSSQIYESHRYSLAGFLRQLGATPVVYPIVHDDFEAIRQRLELAFAENDVVLTSGGVSVGAFDWVKGAFQALGGEVDFWKVAIKPGKPFVWGKLNGGFLFGLPGNPVSAFVTFLLLVRPGILSLQGVDSLELPSHPGKLTEPVSNPGARRHFMRVRVDKTGNISLAGGQGSHHLGALAEANGLLDVAPGSTLNANETVSVLRWEWS